MATLLHFTITILLTLLHQPVSCAETSVFVLKGQDVRLDVQGKEDLTKNIFLTWKFNKSQIVVTYLFTQRNSIVTPVYNGRVEFSVGNFSLLLKKLQEGDSGHYDVVVTGAEERNVGTYLIKVQATVKQPVLRVDSVSSIKDTCNMTVTCRGQNTSVTSSCNSSTCSQVGGESRGAETSTVPLLSVYVAGRFVICNHSNQVSWANDKKEIKKICPMKSNQDGKPAVHYNTLTVIIIIIIIVVVLVIIALICIGLRGKLNKGGKEEVVYTDYATVGNPGTSHEGGEEQVFPGPGLPSIYSMVGHPHPQPVNQPTMVGDQPPPVDISMASMPESIYAVVGEKTSKQ